MIYVGEGSASVAICDKHKLFSSLSSANDRHYEHYGAPCHYQVRLGKIVVILASGYVLTDGGSLRRFIFFYF